MDATYAAAIVGTLSGVGVYQVVKYVYKQFKKGDNVGTINIAGRTYTGNNISIINGVVTIDGVQQGQSVQGVVEVRILEGTINHLTTSSSVSCQNVTGNVDAGGSVNCGDVGGFVDAGGSVNCGKVGGYVDAGGSVHCAK